MAWKLSNFARMALTQSAALADTTIYVDPSKGDLLPTLTSGDQAPAILFNSAYLEIVYITAKSAGALTVTRAREGTSARDWAAGTVLIHTPTADALQTVLNAVAAQVFSGTVTNVSNAYTLTISGTIPTLDDGETLTFEVNATNTDAATLVVTNGTDSTTSKPLVHPDGHALRAGDLEIGFQVTAVFNTTEDAWVLTSIASWNLHAKEINDGPLATANRIANGNFAYWNGGTSFSTPASSAEVADNYYVEYDGSIGTFTVSRQTFTLGQTDVEGEPKYFLRWDHSAAGSGSTYRRLRVKLPGVHYRAGRNVHRAVYLKADSARTVTAKIIQHFGTGGAPSADVTADSTALSVTTSWTRFEIEDTLPSISGKTLGSGGDDGIILSLDLPVNVTMTIDVAMDMFEPGHLASDPHAEYPLSTRQGGSGGSYATQALLAAAIATAGGLMTTAAHPDLAAIEALGSTGFAARTASNTWAQRTFGNTTGLTWTNPAGIAGNPSVALSAGLVDYHNDPMSSAELSSITGAFGTAAFVNTGTSGGTVPLLNGTNSWSGVQTIAVGAVATALVVQSDGSSNVGGQILAYHNNAGAATPVNDYIGRFTYTGRDSANAQETYGYTQLRVLTNTAGAEDAQWDVTLIQGGSRGVKFLVEPDGDCVATGQLRGTSFVPTSSSVPTNGVYLPAANTLGFAANSAGEVQLTSTALSPIANDGSVLGTTSLGWGDLHGATGFTLNIANGNWVLTHSSGVMTVTTGDFVLPSATALSSAYSAGFAGAPVIDGNAAYAFPLTEGRGHTIYHDEAGTRTYTIPANASVAHPIGTMFIIDNTGNSGAAGAITLAITSDTLRRGDGTAGTGSRTIPASGVAVIRKVAATVWVITGIFT